MKQFKVVVQNIAIQDVKDACKWYNDQQPGLAKRFIIDMKQTLRSIEMNPYSYAVRYQNIRLANFPVFPYAVHFIIDDLLGKVYVIAFLHTKRNPNTTQERLKK